MTTFHDPGLRQGYLNDVPVGTLVTVIAGAGAGKSTLLERWRATSVVDSVLVTLDARHDEELALGRHLIAALSAVVPEVAPLVPASRSSRPDWRRAVLPALIQKLRTHPVVAMFDDVQVLTDARAQELLRTFIQQQLRIGVVVLSGRSIPPIAPVGAQVTRITGRHLRLGDDDIADAAGGLLTPHQASALATATGGWAAAVHVALAQVRKGAIDPDEPAALTLQTRLARYLEEEVIDPMPADLVHLLEIVAVLPDATADDLAAVVGRDELPGRLVRLASAGLGLTRVNPQASRPVALHAIMRDTVSARLRREDEDRYRDLVMLGHRTAVAQGRYLDAFAALVELGDTARAADFVATEGLKAVLRGLGSPVQRSLDRLGDALLADPRLLLVQAAKSASEADFVGARNWLELLSRRQASAAGAADRPLDFLASALAPARDNAPDAGPWPFLAELLAAISIGSTGAFRLAENILSTSRSHAEGYPLLEMLWAGTILPLWAWMGEHERGEDLLAATLELVEREGLANNPLAVCLEVACAQYAMLTGRPDDALVKLRTARLAIADLGSGIELAQCCWIVTLAEVSDWLGDVPTTRTLAREARDLLAAFPEATALDKMLSSLEARLPTGSRAESPALTTAELRVLHHLASFLPAHRIAAELTVAVPTVRSHIRSIYEKLGVHSRSEAVEAARLVGLLS